MTKRRRPLPKDAKVILPGFAELYEEMLERSPEELVAMLRDPDLDPVQVPVRVAREAAKKRHPSSRSAKR